MHQVIPLTQKLISRFCFYIPTSYQDDHIRIQPSVDWTSTYSLRFLPFDTWRDRQRCPSSLLYGHSHSSSARNDIINLSLVRSLLTVPNLPRDEQFHKSRPLQASFTLSQQSIFTFLLPSMCIWISTNQRQNADPVLGSFWATMISSQETSMYFNNDWATKAPTLQLIHKSTLLLSLHWILNSRDTLDVIAASQCDQGKKEHPILANFHKHMERPLFWASNKSWAPETLWPNESMWASR